MARWHPTPRLKARLPGRPMIVTGDSMLGHCRIRITQGKGGKDRVVPFPAVFKETLALHIEAQRRASPWRSTPASPSPTPSNATTTP